MVNDALVAIFRDEGTESLIGYTYVGKEFVEFIEEFPDLRFVLGYKSTFVGLETLPRLSAVTLAKYPELKIALADLNRREKERKERPKINSVSSLLMDHLADKIVQEAIKVRDKAK